MRDILRVAPLAAILLTACATTAPAPQLSPRDPSDPHAPESAPVPFDPGLDRPVVSASAAPTRGAWFCPMHRHVTQAEAGRCHVCGMALEKTPDAEPQP